mmetsp:Transcript_71995/g.164951  ORF Transcript_71995/g.164951 Transcript_71995/m.164951 type:complete len:303 (-) Transcript_71995:233-1141(-)
MQSISIASFRLRVTPGRPDIVISSSWSSPVPSWAAAAVEAVASSMYSGTLMCTLEPRRLRMLLVRVAKRGWLLIRRSEQSEDCDTPRSPGEVSGHVKSPTPIRGKVVTVGRISLSSRAARRRRRRRRSESSTRRRSRTNPPNGSRGVPSTIHEPYSGCHAHASLRLSARPKTSSLSRRVSRTCSPRRESFTVFFVSSTLRMWYSSSSPHSSFSSSRSLCAKKVLMNCSTPCSRTYPSHCSESSHASGVPCTSSPPPRSPCSACGRPARPRPQVERPRRECDASAPETTAAPIVRSPHRHNTR